MPDGLFSEIDDVQEGEQLVVDIDPLTAERDRGVAVFEADRVAAYDNVPVSTEESTGSVGALMEDDDSGGLGLFQQRQTTHGQKIADIENVTRTDRADLDPIGIGRDRRSGEFTPDNTVPAPNSPSDRDPDDGEFTTPDPRPVTDIGRKQSNGLFDLF
jgi:hypothetical protein